MKNTYTFKVYPAGVLIAVVWLVASIMALVHSELALAGACFSSFALTLVISVKGGKVKP